jgi:hypothetical protein
MGSDRCKISSILLSYVGKGRIYVGKEEEFTFEN